MKKITIRAKSVIKLSDEKYNADWTFNAGTPVLSVIKSISTDYEQLQTKLAESEARVGRLEHLIKRVLLESCDETAWPLYEELRNVYDETPTQSLATHECLFIDEFLNHLRYEFDWLFGEDNPQERALQNCAIDFIKLRQQQTNGE